MVRGIFSLQKERQKRGSVGAQAKIIAVGGGKGGVGKSFISSSLAIFLSNMGYKTLLVDLDLGSANLHTCIGAEPSERSLIDFFNSPESSLEDIIVPSLVPNLTFVSGSNDSLDMADLDSGRKSELMSAIFKTETDYIILDLGAGTHSTTLDFFLMAHYHFITVTPNPASIENAYRFIKSSFFRTVKRYEEQVGLKSTIDRIMGNYKDLGVNSPFDLINELKKIEPIKTDELLRHLNCLDFKLIVNQTRTQRDKQLGHSIQSVCGKYFGIPLEYVGYLEYDNAVWRSLQRRKAFLLESANSPNYVHLLRIARQLAFKNNQKVVV